MAPASACIVHPRWIQPHGDDEGSALLPPATAWQCDLADETLTWGDGVFDLFGIPRGARVDRREIVAMYDDASRGQLERCRRRAIATGTSFTLDARIRTLAGEWRWMRIKATTQLRGGKAVRLYGKKLLLRR